MRVRCGCGKVLNVSDSLAGGRARCPACGKVFKVPAPGGGGGAAGVASGASRETDEYGVEVSRCPNCGTELQVGAQFCVVCGTHLATGAKFEQVDVEGARRAQKSERVKRALMAARYVVGLVVLVVVCWVGWTYVIGPKYRAWREAGSEDSEGGPVGRRGLRGPSRRRRRPVGRRSRDRLWGSGRRRSGRRVSRDRWGTLRRRRAMRVTWRLWSISRVALKTRWR